MREISELIQEPSKKQGERIEAEDLAEDFTPLDFDEQVKPKQKVLALQPVDHSKVHYDSKAKFEFQSPPSNLSTVQVSEFLQKYKIEIRGPDVKPALDFSHLPIEASLISKLAEMGILIPTPIQSIALPVAFEGKDLLAVSQTASGKTLAFALPIGYLVRGLSKSQRSQGPTSLVLVPTRELCLQVLKDVKKFLGPFKLKIVALYGGVPKSGQWKELKMGADVVIATPARLIDLVQSKACTLKTVSQLVIDEADLMFNMGFEYQVRSILSQIRPDRQTLLFSATFRKRLEGFIEDVLKSPVKVTIGTSVHCNPGISQEIVVLEHSSKKLSWVLERLPRFLQDGLVLIFVKHKSTTEELFGLLKSTKIPCGNLHGDMDQSTRESTFASFIEGGFKVLVATDVASRGLNVVNIGTVINYDCAKDVETHVHRIGRTGRNDVGKAFTLLTKADKRFAGDLLLNLEYNEQEVPEKLEKLAMEDSIFRVQRMKNDKGKIRHCKTADPNTANVILGRIVGKKVNIEEGNTAEDLRQAIMENQRECFQEDFKQKFVNAGVMESSVNQTTVSYVEKKRKRFDV